MYHAPDPPGEFELPLNMERLKWQLEVLGWERGELARRLEINPTKVGAWCNGRSFVPNTVAMWLEMMARTMLANPTPLFWEGREGNVGRMRHGHEVEEPEAV